MGVSSGSSSGMVQGSYSYAKASMSTTS
jgi:hypothetical protein